MPRTWFEVAAQAADKSASIAIRGYIGEWGVNDVDFAREIEALGDVEMINVSINSRGGEISHALSIFNILRNHKALVSVRIDGVAASAATIIAMAGDEIIMPSNTMMLVHRPLISGWVTAGEDDLRALADGLKVFESALVETYIARTGKSEEDLKALLDEDRWMTAQESVDLGFADKVESLVRPSAVAIAEASSIPDEMLVKIAAIEAAAAEVPEGDGEAGGDDSANANAADDAAELNAAGDPNTAPETPTQPDAKAVAKTAAAIVAKCCEHGMPHLASGFIEQGLSEIEAAAKLLDVKAAHDEARHIDPNLPAPVGPDPNATKDSWNNAFNKVRN